MDENRRLADATASHSVLNYLGASLAGKFAFYTALVQLELSTPEEEDLKSCLESLELVHEWVGQLDRGSAFVSTTWTEPESFEAIKAVDLLTKLKGESYTAGGEIAQIFVSGLAGTTPASTRLLLAALLRYNYGRDYFLRGQVRFSEAYNQIANLERAKTLLLESEKDISFVSEALALLKTDDDPASPITNLIVYRSTGIPGIFRTATHDINQILSPFRGGLSWNSLEFSPQEQNLWGGYQIDPSLAGYWRAYAFSPEEAATWIEKGLPNAAVAFEWKKHGFPPEQAEPWGKAGFPPLGARAWSSAGFTLEQSMEHVRKGIYDPAQLDR